MKTKTYLSLAALFSVLLFVSTRAEAQLSYTVTDLGTLGGTTSSANGVSGPGHNVHGMIVGSSTTTDGAEHAFLYVSGQMYDLNTLCDLSLTEFKVLTVAKSISDSCLIIGDGVTNSGEKHAFLLTPTAIDGGNWSYVCCQWVWIQEGGGWWWETGSHSYTWHGLPGPHSASPLDPPHCWWWPLPCPPNCGCDHPPPPPDYCYCCINGSVYLRPVAECRANGGQCYGSPEEAIKYCRPYWSCIGEKVVQTTWAECQAKGTQCYNSFGEAKKLGGAEKFFTSDMQVKAVSRR